MQHASGTQTKERAADHRDDVGCVAAARTLGVVRVDGATADGGQAQEFQVRLFNAKGQFLRMAKADEVEFSVAGPGKIAKRDIPGEAKARKGWEYSTPKEVVHTSVQVTAKFGKNQGSARIRLVPDYTWKFDFSDGQVPVTWVGCRYRHISLDFALLKKIEKEGYFLFQLETYN